MNEFPKPYGLGAVLLLLLATQNKIIIERVERSASGGIKIMVKVPRVIEAFTYTFSVCATTVQWDVTKARDLVEDDSEEVERAWIDITSLLKLIERGHVAFDPALVHTADITNPVIVAPAPPKSDGTHIVIDGWERLAKARELSRTELPAFILNKEQNARCVIAVYSAEGTWARDNYALGDKA